MEISTQEAERLFKMPKKRFEEYLVKFPEEGKKLTLEFISDDKRYNFQGDINRQGHIKAKLGFQNRYNKVIILRRLDIIGSPHTNPPDAGGDEFLMNLQGKELPCPHLHFYVEGYDSRWALPLAMVDDLNIKDTDRPSEITEKFFHYCNLEVPKFELRLFE